MIRFWRADDQRLGALLGLTAPVLGTVGYYLIRFRQFPFRDYWRVLGEQSSLLTGVLSLSLLVSVAWFTWFTNTEKHKTARGVFLATCGYAALGLLWKWLA
jgi:hypothetical protein